MPVLTAAKTPEEEADPHKRMEGEDQQHPHLVEVGLYHEHHGQQQQQQQQQQDGDHNSTTSSNEGSIVVERRKVRLLEQQSKITEVSLRKKAF